MTILRSVITPPIELYRLPTGLKQRTPRRQGTKISDVANHRLIMGPNLRAAFAAVTGSWRILI
jgi:hypothetical protein